MPSDVHEALELQERQRRSAPPEGGLSDLRLPEEDPDVDGGYAWVVVCACSVLCFWYVGQAYTWGVMQLRLTRDGLAPAATLAFIGSVSTALLSVLALGTTRVIRKVGNRNTAVLGVCCLGCGWIASGWTSNSLAGLFITAGVLPGIGCALCFFACSTLPGQYFVRRRGLANGIVFAGGGLGGSVLSIINTALLERVGVAWSFRIIGFSALAICLPTTMLLKERVPRPTNPIIEWPLFRDAKFSLLFLAGGIGTFPLFVAPFFLPLYASSLGYSNATGALILAGFNLSSTGGRLGFGAAADMVGPLNALFCALLLTGISMLAIWPISTSLGPLIIFIILNGASNGGFFATMPTVIGSVFGSRRLATSMGMIITSWVGGYLMGAPIAGYILQSSGGSDAGLAAYRPAMYYAGSLSLASAGLVAYIRFLSSPILLHKI